jgi:Lrp/AsnC family transcriptional regulator, leucine-responsive regulatory protein
LIDNTDRRILALLQDDARMPVAEIARIIELAASAVHLRIRKLEEAGVIQAYETRIDPRAVDRELVSFVRVRTGEGASAPELNQALTSIPEVQEVHRVVGEDCFFVKVRVRGPEELADLLDHRLQRIPGVASTHTTIVLTTAKESFKLPLDVPENDQGPRLRAVSE